MFKAMLPEQLTNDYRGKPIAKWFFVVLTIMTVARSLIHILAPDGGAQSIATIPLDAFAEWRGFGDPVPQKWTYEACR